ncbi:NlpC/P60 family protein [Pseudobacillus sp. FSL P4-0506]|uniref:C40 family peptidase n=1 Tax=Pseudobacillus sp. FSL P4-0506 TaxID=2921576 RepID=UPI0030F8C451
MRKKSFKYTASLAILATFIQTTTVFASPVTEGQINETKGQIQSTQLQIDNLDTKIQQLDDKISVSMDKSSKLDAEIKTQQEKIKKTKSEIKEAQKTFDAHQAVYSERLRSIQKQGQKPLLTYAEVLVSSQNLSDFFSRATAVSSILQSDSDLMTGLKEKGQELTDTKEKLDKQMKSLKRKQDELASEQVMIEKNKKEVQKQLADSKNTLEAQQSQLVQQQTQLREQEQARLKAQQEAQRQEQQARLKEQQEAQLHEQQTKLREQQEARLSEQQDQSGEQQQDQLAQKSPTAFKTPKVQTAHTDNDSNLTTSSDKVEKVIEYAKKYMGVPYVWGGTTPKGFDCSGFTSYVFRNTAGIELPRISRDQQDVGKRIPTNQVQPGDLVFRGNPAYHVGIYIGGGKYIHAPHTGDVVKISNYNPSSFSTASRILN